MKHDSELLAGGAQIAGEVTQPVLPHAAAEKASLKLGHLGVEAVYPLTPVQRDLYLASVLNPDTLDVCIGYAISITKSFQIDTWNAVLLAFQERQPMLRTRIYEGSDQHQEQYQNSHHGNDVACQCVSTQASFDVEVQDLTNIKYSDGEIESLVRDFVYSPYDIHSSELVRYRIWRLDGGRTIFAMGCHHILMDGVSLASHLSQIADDYNQALASDSSDDSDDSDVVNNVGYLDLAEKFSDEFDTQDIREFWSQKLQNVEPISLKVLKNTEKERVEKFSKENVTKETLLLDADRIDLIKRYCRQQVVTPAIFFRNVYALLLNKYGNPVQPFIIHSAHSFRPKDHELNLGLYVNQVPFVFDPSVLDGPVEALFSSSRHFQKSIRGYEKLSVGETKQLAPSEDVEFVYNFIDFVPSLSLNGSAIDVSRYTNHPRNQVQLVVQTETDGVSLNLYHYSEEFNSCRFLDRMDTIIEQLLSGGGDLQSLHYVLLDEEEEINDWNNTATEYPETVSVHQQFQQQVLLTPNKVALVHGEHSLSYQELNHASNQLAHYLLTQGVVAGDFVGLCLDRSFDMMIGALAILKTGAAYVPLDPGYPVDRLAYMLEDCCVSIVLTHKALEENLPVASGINLHRNHVCLDDANLTSMLANFSEENLLPTDFSDELTAAESLAYVIYTSGSTGQPKGVCVYHKGVSRLCKNSNYIQISPEDTVTHLSNVSFDAATFELWGALLNGATAVVVDRDVLLSDDALAQYFADHCVSVMFITTALFHYYAIHRVDIFKQFRVVLFGGESCDPSLVAKVYQEAKPNHLINIYGPTENTVFSLWYEITGCVQEGLTIPIGKSISNTTLYVLDKNQHVMPPGLAGELYLGGDGIAKGYLNRNELTNTVFIEHPKFGRIYKTGDWVRVNTEGNVEYLGRIDDQVKIRGFRIEIGEIEKSLLTHKGISEAVVIAREDQPGHKVLVAYCVVDDGDSDEVADFDGLDKQLRQFMKSQLPEYMVPSTFVLLDQLPLTANGKIDKKSLPKPQEQAGDKDYVQPTTYQEKILSLIWSEVLGGQKVGVNDNFFELGGDSIISIQIISRAKRVGLHLQPQHLFEHPTIAELASIASSERISIIAEQGIVEGKVPMLPIQQWFMEEHQEDRQHFNHGLMLAVKEVYSESDIENVITALVEKHDGLRGQFVNQHKENHATHWQQYIHSFEQESIELKCLCIEENEWANKDNLLADFANDLHRGFEFDKDDLCSFGFIKTPKGQDNRLLLIVHHLLIDVVSWRILMEDINVGLANISDAKDIDLGFKTTSVQQWGSALIEYSKTDVVLGKLAYWRALSDLKYTALPTDSLHTDSTCPNNTYGQLNEYIASLDIEQTKQLLSQVNGAYRTDIEDVLLSALAMTISQWASSQWDSASEKRAVDLDSMGNAVPNKVYLQLESHGRENISTSVDVTGTLGWFTSVFPVLLDIDGIDLTNPSNYGMLIQTVKEQIRQIGVGDGGFSFGLLRYMSDNDTRQQLESVPTPEVVFNYLGQLDNILTLDHGSYATNESVGEMCGSKLRRQQLLDINCRIEEGQFKAFWSYNSDIHDEITIANVANQYIDCLSTLIDYCLKEENKGISPSDVPLIEIDQAGLDHMVETILQKNAAFSVANIQSIYPLSPMQEGMLFHSVYQPESAFYIDQMELQVEGGIDLEILTSAWQKVVARHDILRTAFIHSGVQKPIQVVFDNVDVKIDVYDWSQDDRDMTFSEWLVADKEKGFIFSDPGLFRFSWFILPNQEQRLVWTFQHILLDGWSLPLVLGEVMQTYSDLLNGNPTPAGSVPQYQNFIRWLSIQPKREAEAYWREYLSGFSAPNIFPQMKTITLQESTHAEWHESVLELDEGTLQSLNDIAHDQHLTLNTIVQGAWALLLSRYSRENDVVFGTTVSGRPAELRDVEQTVGIFINTLPLRTKIDGESTFSSWLKGLQQQQVEMRRYEHVPLVDVQSVSEVSSKQALFDSIVVFENYPMDQSFFDYLPIKLTEVKLVEHANYPLTLIVIPGKTLTFKMSYNSSLFDEVDVQRMLGHLLVMLKGVANQPDTLLKNLPWLTESEVAQVTTEWNRTEVAYSSESSLVNLFEQNVKRYPDYTAVSFGEETLSYHQLNALSNRFASEIMALGVLPGDKVAVVMGRSISMIISTIGILKAGAVYVPIDPSYPEDRISYMLADTGATLSVTCSKDEERIATLSQCLHSKAEQEQNHQLLVWERFFDECLMGDDEKNHKNPNVSASSSNLAYVIYTSGSTGTPKGVCVTQRSVSRLVVNTNYVEILPGDSVAHISNVSFDAATFDIWGALLNGGEIVGFDNETFLDAEKLSLVLAEKNIKAMFLTVALFNLLTKQKLDVFFNVDTLLFGGEHADPKQVRNVLYGKEGMAPPQRLINVYGPTENTTFSTFYPIMALDESVLNVPIGKPISNSSAYILDDMKRPVPVGVPGELYVGGFGVAEGYLNQAELTESFFTPNPYLPNVFGTGANSKLYRTGDICRFLSDGNIEILGRIDDQVKIRGFRIELGEVEGHLNAITGVSNACVLVKQNQQNDKHMVAYILLDEGVDFTANSLKCEMKKRVPDYLIPAAFVVIEKLPLNANGKVDKQQLPEPDEFCYDNNQYVMPKNEIETQLADIWQDVLGITRVSVNDDFFDLGGHSLLVTQVVSRIREEMEIDISLRTLFEATTIATVAEIIAVVMPSPEMTRNSDQTGCGAQGDEDDDDEFEEFTL